MVQSIKHLGSELEFEAFRDLEHLDKPQVEIPVSRRREDVAAVTDIARGRQAEAYVGIGAARIWISRDGVDLHRLKQHGTREGLVGQVLQFRRCRPYLAGARFVTPVGS